jgi:glutamine amidotransferase-like uncharacterized protein
MNAELFVCKDINSPTTKVWQSFFVDYLPEWRLRLCFAKDILSVEPPQHIIFPGGSGAAFYKQLGTEKSSKIIEWVRSGGSYIGVCAGAYLASNHLKLTPLNLPDKAWERGLHDAVIEYQGVDCTVNYHNGPVFEDAEDVEVWARFKSNFLAENGYYAMCGAPAITHNRFGLGCVTLYSPHLEKSSPEMKTKLAKSFEYIHKIHYLPDALY